MISFKNLSFKYKGASRPALENINLTINDGDFIGVIGKSGSGKSTLTYAVNGVIPHYYEGDFYGEVKVDGVDTVGARPEELSMTVGSVLQDVEAQTVLTVVEDELRFGLENFKVPRDDIPKRVDESLEVLGISSLRGSDIRFLSGGQRQKVAIASIIALKPKIIILDEPTGELDPQSARQVFEALKRLNEENGITVIVVEQNIMQLCEYSKKLLVMETGKAAIYGPVREVLKKAAFLEKSGINVTRYVTLANRLCEMGVACLEPPVNIGEAQALIRRLLA